MIMRKTNMNFFWIFNGNSVVDGTDETFYLQYLKKLYLDNTCSSLVVKKEDEQINNFYTNNNNLKKTV